MKSPNNTPEEYVTPSPLDYPKEVLERMDEDFAVFMSEHNFSGPKLSLLVQAEITTLQDFADLSGPDLFEIIKVPPQNVITQKIYTNCIMDARREIGMISQEEYETFQDECIKNIKDLLALEEHMQKCGIPGDEQNLLIQAGIATLKDLASLDIGSFYEGTGIQKLPGFAQKDCIMRARLKLGMITIESYKLFARNYASDAKNKRGQIAKAICPDFSSEGTTITPKGGLDYYDRVYTHS